MTVEALKEYNKLFPRNKKYKINVFIKHLQKRGIEPTLDQYKIYEEYRLSNPKDSASLNFFVAKYGKEVGETIYKNKVEASKQTLENCII